MPNIEDTLSIVNKAVSFEKAHPGFVKNNNYKSKLVDIRRELGKIKFATDENCSVAVFGESQVGKSYLVSAMLSESDSPFCVEIGGKSYNFKEEINPAEPNSQIEATGVITRFTARNTNVPNGYLKVHLLTIPDIVLILAEAYYNQVDREIRNANNIMNNINARMDECKRVYDKNANPVIDEVDVADIEEY